MTPSWPVVELIEKLHGNFKWKVSYQVLPLSDHSIMDKNSRPAVGLPASNPDASWRPSAGSVISLCLLSLSEKGGNKGATCPKSKSKDEKLQMFSVKAALLE